MLFIACRMGLVYTEFWSINSCKDASSGKVSFLNQHRDEVKPKVVVMKKGRNATFNVLMINRNTSD